MPSLGGDTGNSSGRGMGGFGGYGGSGEDSVGGAGYGGGRGGFTGYGNISPGKSLTQKELEDIAGMNSSQQMAEGKAMTEAMEKAAAVAGMTFSEFMETALSTVKGVAALAKGDIFGAISTVTEVKGSLNKSKDRIKAEIDQIAKDYAKEVKGISGRDVDQNEALGALLGYRDSSRGSSSNQKGGYFGGHAEEIINNLPPNEREEGRRIIEGYQAEQVGQGSEGKTNDPKVFWDEFKTEFFDSEDNAKALIQEHADYMRDAGKKYTDTIEGKGEVSPFKFSMLGQDVSFVPRVNREVAKSVFDTANTTSPVTGKLSYLDALMNPAELEEKKRQADIAASLDTSKINNAYNLGLGNLEVAKDVQKQNEPGWLDYLGAGTGILDGLFGDGGLFS